MLFESADYDAEVFASAEEFLYAGHLDESACLVLDVQLPGISGLDLQDRLRADGNDISVIFITAHPDEHTRQLAMLAGATRFFFETIQRQRPPHRRPDASITLRLRRVSDASALWITQETGSLISLK